MKKILVRIYQSLSPGMRKTLGQSIILKPFRSIFLRSKGEFKETDVIIHKSYPPFKVSFRFFSSIQIAAKARDRGIENTLIKNSLTLLKKRKGDSNEFTIFDVGSNFGYLSLVWAQTIASSGKVIAFEPNARVVQSLRKSVVANKLEERISVEKVAVGNEDKDIILYNFNTTSNTLEFFDPSLVKTEGSTVKMIRLDDFVHSKRISKVDLLKIDVDGIELEILKGAKKLIQKFKPLIIVEVNEEFEIINFLRGIGYVILNPDLEPYKYQDLNSNLFCVPIEGSKYK